MSKLKPLLPTLRERKRYLAFQVLSNTDCNDIKLIINEIMKSAVQFLGSYHFGDAGILVMPKDFDIRAQVGIIRVSHLYTNHLKVILAHINKVGNTKVIIRTCGVSGVLLKVRQKYIQPAKRIECLN